MVEISPTVWFTIHIVIVIVLVGGLLLWWFVAQIRCRNAEKINVSGSGRKIKNAKMWNSAISKFTNQLTSNPNDAILHCNLGIALYLGKKDWKKAFAEFNSTISLNPFVAEAFYYRGQIFRRFLDEKYAAISDEAMSLKLNPKIKTKCEKYDGVENIGMDRLSEVFVEG